MNDKENWKSYTIIRGDIMSLINTVMKKILIFEKEPQMVGLSQFKHELKESIPAGPSIGKKDVKLSDLMRRAG